MIEQTLAIIKPNVVKEKNSGAIIDIIEKNNFDILRMEKIQLSKKRAIDFYVVHKEKPFFNELIDFIISGPIIVMVLEKNNAVQAWRDLMGCTDSRKAASGTIRNLFGTDKLINAVHGSDSPENAKQEIVYFFPTLER